MRPRHLPIFHAGEGNTGFHASGAAARLDYVVLSQCLRSCQVRTSIAEIDLAMQKLDHVAVQVDLPIEFSCRVNPRCMHDFRPLPTFVTPFRQTLSGMLMCTRMLPPCNVGYAPHNHLAPRLFEEKAI